jgi:hypothetical protein
MITIAEDACMDPRTCRRVLSALERKGVIHRIRAENQGRGQLTFYSFPELDKAFQKAQSNGSAQHGKGGQNARLFYAKRRTEGGPKEDKNAPHTKGRTETETQKQKPIPHIPLAGARGSAASGREPAPGPAPGLFDDGPPACGAIEAAIEATMSACSWTKKRLRDKLRAVLRLELDKGGPPATTGLAIAAAWKHQAENSHLLRVKFGAANFLELGVWKNANLLQWDHERMDRGGARL